MSLKYWSIQTHSPTVFYTLNQITMRFCVRHRLTTMNPFFTESGLTQMCKKPARTRSRSRVHCKCWQAGEAPTWQVKTDKEYFLPSAHLLDQGPLWFSRGGSPHPLIFSRCCRSGIGCVLRLLLKCLLRCRHTWFSSSPSWIPLWIVSGVIIPPERVKVTKTQRAEKWQPPSCWWLTSICWCIVSLWWFTTANVNQVYRLPQVLGSKRCKDINMRTFQCLWSFYSFFFNKG